MIRRDYILRMIEEFVRALARVHSLKENRRGSEAGEIIDQEFQRLIGRGPEAATQLSETELFACLVNDGPTHAVRDKAFMLATLLSEAGDLATEKGQWVEGQAYWLKALHVLLDVLGRGEVYECPEFVPKIEVLRSALGDQPLPARTLALLMHHYERSGEFGKAEDALFAILKGDPAHGAPLDLGVAFYERLLGQSEAALIVGNLPRDEVKAGLEELNRRSRFGMIRSTTG